MSDWRTRHDQDLTREDIAAMRAAATNAERLLAAIKISNDPLQETVIQLCEALGEPYESDDHGLRQHTYAEVLAMVRARSDAWRTLLARIEVVDPQWLDGWRRSR